MIPEKQTVVSDKQHVSNREEETWYEQMLSEQRQRFENHLRFSVDSALTYKCSESQAEDWLDTPEITAKLIIEL